VIEDLLRLQKASQRINSLLDLDQLIDRIVNDVACSFGLVEVNVYLYEQDRAELVLASVHGCTINGKGHCLKLGTEGMVGYVAATGQMRYAPDVHKDQYYLACEESTLSEVAIPLLVEERLVGVFTASHPALNAFPPQQLKILQALCSHIAAAVQNARLFQQARQERELMTREALEARNIQQALLPKSSPYIPGFARLWVVHSGRSRRWRLVRFHPYGEWPLGAGAGRCLGKRHCSGPSHGCHPRDTSLARRSLLWAQ
jgi:sigma-B regulation protein RsbU (phosphoserine phosphatase)